MILQNFFPRQSSEFVCLVSCFVLLLLAVGIQCFANKHNIVGCLVGWNNNKLMMKFGQLSTNVWITKHRFMSYIRLFTKDITALTIQPLRPPVWPSDSGFLYLGPLERTSLRLLLCTILSSPVMSPVIMWPDGLYRNSED